MVITPASSSPKSLNDLVLHITPNQMRTARSRIGWSRERLAARSDTTATFIRIYEDTGRTISLKALDRPPDPLAAIRSTLREAGVIFINVGKRGVRVRVRNSAK